MPPVKVDLGAGDRTPSRPTGMLRDASLLYPALVILLTVFAVAPLTYPFSFQTHTGFNPVYNLMDLDAHFSTSPTWAPAFGRGYDPLRTDGPIPYFAGELLHLLGFSFSDSIKAVYALAFLLSGIGMFSLARSVFQNEAAGILGAIVYVYFPYHLADVFVRGAIGEATEWALLPFALLAVLKLRRSPAPTPREYLMTIAAFALPLLAQPGLGLVFGLGTLTACLLIRPRHARSRLAGEWTIGIGILLGGALLLPALLQNRGMVGSYSFTPAFVLPFQFLTATSGSDLPKGNYLEQFPYQIGIAPLGLTIIALGLLFRPGVSSDISQNARRASLFPLIVGVTLLVLMTSVASPVWDITRATLLVEYPFELLVFVGLALSITPASILVSDERFSQTAMLAALTILPILAAYTYLAPEFVDFTPSQPPVALFNQNEIALLDAKIVRPPGILRHGATVQLDLTWQALRQVNHDYTVFVHVLDNDGKEWGSEDSKPQDGALPTVRWSVGRVITDTHTVQIDLAGPPEGYHLEIGLYNAVDQSRAATESGATEIRVEENRE